MFRAECAFALAVPADPLSIRARDGQKKGERAGSEIVGLDVLVSRSRESELRSADEEGAR